MLRRTVTVDLSAPKGRIRPVMGGNLGPLSGWDLSFDFSAEFGELAIPWIRVADVEPPFGGGRFVDIANIFPDPSLDERFAESYRFGPTDKYRLSVAGTGAEIYLRIGQSPSPDGDCRPDPLLINRSKLAGIARRIIAHYNQGWANGYKLGIKMVEIWCDPDRFGSPFADAEDYADLYRTVAAELKGAYPRLKVGCYSSGGFAGMNHFDATDEVKRFPEFLERFLTAISSRGEEAPLDFLSWKCYAYTPEEISLHANYARSYLNSAGFKRTQSVISEFNMRSALSREAYASPSYPAELASSMIIAQKSAVDMMFYSDLSPRSGRCALFTLDDNLTHRRYASFEVMKAMGRIFRHSSAVDGTEDYRREIYSLASSSERGATVILAVRDYSGQIDLCFKNCPFKGYSITGLVGGGERGEGRVTKAEGLSLPDGSISIRAGKDQVYIVDLEP